jgi:hypothetical protein
MRLISDSGRPAMRRDQALVLRAQPREDEPALEKAGAPPWAVRRDEQSTAGASAAERNAHVVDAELTAT